MKNIIIQLKKEARALLIGAGIRTKSAYSIGIDIGIKHFRAARVYKSLDGFSVKEVVVDDAGNLAILPQKINFGNAEDVVVNFSSRSLLIRRVSIPQMPHEEIKEALKWQLKDEIGSEIQDSKFVFSILEQASAEGLTKKIELMAVVYKESEIEVIVEKLRKLNIDVQVVMPSVFSAANYVHSSKLIPAKEKAAVIDIGSNMTTLSIIGDGNVYFTRDTAIGGDTLTEAMTHMLITNEGKFQFSLEDAEKFKCEQGITNDIKIFSMMRPVLEKLAGFIKASLLYYEENYKSHAIKKVILMGNGAKLKGLKEYLKSNIDIEVLADLPEESCAIGMALSTNTSLNMLPETVVMENKKKLKEVSFRMFIAVLGVIFLFAFLLLSVRQGVLQLQYKSYKKYQEEIKDIKAIYDKITDYKNASAIVSSESIQMGHIMKVISICTLPSVRLDDLIIQEAIPNIKLSGVVLEEGDMTVFMSNLENSDVFENVRLVSTNKDENNADNAVNFKIEFNTTKN